MVRYSRMLDEIDAVEVAAESPSAESASSSFSLPYTIAGQQDVALCTQPAQGFSNTNLGEWLLDPVLRRLELALAGYGCSSCWRFRCRRRLRGRSGLRSRCRLRL